LGSPGREPRVPDGPGLIEPQRGEIVRAEGVAPSGLGDCFVVPNIPGAHAPGYPISPLWGY
jgi:hypothetical protein